MATQCRGTKTKRINRHKLAVIQAYIIIGTLVLIGFIGGLVVGRATAPKKQVTVIATDTKRQADKKEQTIVKVGNRTINDAVTTQKEANGFSFTE